MAQHPDPEAPPSALGRPVWLTLAVGLALVLAGLAVLFLMQDTVLVSDPETVTSPIPYTNPVRYFIAMLFIVVGISILVTAASEFTAYIGGIIPWGGSKIPVEASGTAILFLVLFGAAGAFSYIYTPWTYGADVASSHEDAALIKEQQEKLDIYNSFFTSFKTESIGVLRVAVDCGDEGRHWVNLESSHDGARRSESSQNVVGILKPDARGRQTRLPLSSENIDYVLKADFHRSVHQKIFGANLSLMQGYLTLLLKPNMERKDNDPFFSLALFCERQKAGIIQDVQEKAAPSPISGREDLAESLVEARSPLDQ